MEGEASLPLLQCSQYNSNTISSVFAQQSLFHNGNCDISQSTCMSVVSASCFFFYSAPFSLAVLQHCTQPDCRVPGAFVATRFLALSSQRDHRAYR